MQVILQIQPSFNHIMLPAIMNYGSYSIYQNVYFLSLAAMYIHDPVYQISSPGSHLDDIPSWEGRLKKMGGANTAYWPNYPIRLPKEVKWYHVKICFSHCGKNTRVYKGDKICSIRFQ